MQIGSVPRALGNPRAHCSPLLPVRQPKKEPSIIKHGERFIWGVRGPPSASGMRSDAGTLTVGRWPFERYCLPAPEPLSTRRTSQGTRGFQAGSGYLTVWPPTASCRCHTAAALPPRPQGLGPSAPCGSSSSLWWGIRKFTVGEAQPQGFSDLLSVFSSGGH